MIKYRWEMIDMQKGERGFTLIELLVSIIILGVITAIMIPVVHMGLASTTTTNVLRYQTDTLQWYKEIAKAKAIALTTLNNENESTPVGDVAINYETHYEGDRKYIVVKPSLGGWLPIVYITPLNASITTRGIYVKITNPSDGTHAAAGDDVNLTIEAYYVENGNTYDVDSVEIYVDGNYDGIASSSGNNLYNYTYHIPTGASGIITITAKAKKGSLEETDEIHIIIDEPSTLVVNITSPPDGSVYLPGEEITVTVDSYVEIGSSRLGVEPSVSLDGNSCQYLSGSGYTYTFRCYAPTSEGTYTILAQASYGNLSSSDSISIIVQSVFKIVDITETTNPSEVDENLPSCVSTATGNYVVVKVSNDIAPLWQSIKTDFTYMSLTFTESAENAYQTTDDKYHYVFIPIPQDLKDIWISLTSVNIRAYLDWGAIHKEDTLTIIRCCEGIFRVSSSVVDHSSFNQVFTAENVLTIWQNTTEDTDLCGYSVDFTQALEDAGVIPEDAEINAVKVEKLYDDTYDKVKIGKWRKRWFGWRYRGIIDEQSTAPLIVYQSYTVGDNTHNQTQNAISSTVGYAYAYFDFTTDPLDSNNFYIEQTLSNENGLYCRWNESSNGRNATRGVEYDTLQKYTFWYKSLFQLSDILTLSPSTTCSVNMNQLSISVEKSDWAYIYSSNCDNFPQVLFTVYLSNTRTIADPTYIIDIFKSNLYNDTWGYTIFDRNCNEIETIYLDSTNIVKTNNGMIASITLPDIPLYDLSSLNLSQPIYSWVKYKATSSDVNTLTVTLTLTATYEVTP